MIARISTLVFVIAIGTSLLMIGDDVTVAKPNVELGVTEPAILESTPIASFTTDTWGIFNPKTGEILDGENIYTEHPIASVTKLFTAYAVLKNDKQDTPVTVTWSDLKAEGRAGKLTYGQQLTREELLFPLLIESSNDAGEAINRSLGQSYLSTVNALCEELALDHTNITDATGLSSRDISAVVDLARFYTYVRNEYPRIMDITRLKLYVSNESGLVNNNPARAFENFTGGKHGFTEDAGRTFVGTFMGADNQSEIGLVFLHSADLTQDIKSALAYIKSHPTLSICYNAGACGVKQAMAITQHSSE